jgi:uncharacterized protein (DUF1810 family)
VIFLDLEIRLEFYEFNHPMPDPQSADPFDLGRFLLAQEEDYEVALSELRRGRKESHWIWHIFPQIEGLGRSEMTRKYSIKSLEEARAYLEHPVLGPRLVECCRAALSVKGRSALAIMGSPDDLKLQSSMTLFACVAGPNSVFHEVLDRHFGGQRDPRTLSLIGIQPQ